MKYLNKIDKLSPMGWGKFELRYRKNYYAFEAFQVRLPGVGIAQLIPCFDRSPVLFSFRYEIESKLNIYSLNSIFISE